MSLTSEEGWDRKAVTRSSGDLLRFGVTSSLNRYSHSARELQGKTMDTGAWTLLPSPGPRPS